MRKCQCGCREPATGGNGVTAWASVECALKIAQKRREKAERNDIKAKREKLKTRSDYMKEAQIAFNRFIRERDKDRPCICCGFPLAQMGHGWVGPFPGGAFDCGHYRSVGSAPHLRFDERNAHGQRKQCNRWGAGRAVDYRIGLIARIGLAAVESLEADHEPKRYTIDDLKQIRDLYRAKLKELKKSQQMQK